MATEMNVDQAIEHIEREYGNVLAYAGRHDWTEGRPLTFNDVATVRWLIREVGRLREDQPPPPLYKTCPECKGKVPEIDDCKVCGRQGVVWR